MRSRFLLLLLALLPGAQPSPAAPPPSPTPATPAPYAAPVAGPTPAPSPREALATPIPLPTQRPKAKQAKPDEWTEARRLFEQLSPDEKNKFLDNLDQWKTMPPEEQELFRDRELFRREKIAQEIQEAIGKSGLHLDEDQREVYALRYTQERRKIEENLRKEMDRKRQMMVTEMLARLKLEFASTPTPAPDEKTGPR